MNYVKYAFVLTTFRNTLRLYNFEQTDDQTALMTAQMCLAFFMIQVFTINFPKTTTNLCISRGFMIGFGPQFIMKIGLWKFDSILNFLITTIYCMVSYKFIDLFCDYSDIVTSGLLDSIKQGHETN